MKWEGDLVRDIRTYTEFDNEDGNQTGRVIRDVPFAGTNHEFSTCNKASLVEYFLKIKDQVKSILEIGVCRNGGESSTYCFLNNKLNETAYVGIDLENKTFLDNQEKRIYTICGNSSDVDQNIEIMKSWGIEQLDFIFIDGWHSINQVLIDWEYTKILSPNGVVAFHDVSEHPGPHMFIRNLNTDIWNVEIRCPTDWGIGFAWRK